MPYATRFLDSPLLRGPHLHLRLAEEERRDEWDTIYTWYRAAPLMNPRNPFPRGFQRGALKESLEHVLIKLACGRKLSGSYTHGVPLERHEHYKKVMNRVDTVGFCIVRNDTEELVGGIVLCVNCKNVQGEMRIVINPEMHGKGIGTEAIRVLLRFAFDDNGFGLREISLVMAQENAPIRTCALRCGFKQKKIIVHPTGMWEMPMSREDYGEADQTGWFL